MKLAKKLVSVAAAAALVAGAGMAASAPASAKLDKKASSTSITLDKTILGVLSQQGITISAVAPAKWNAKKGQITFPVTGVTAEGITHSGGLTFTKDGNPLSVTNPVIQTPVGATSFNVQVTTAGLGDISLLTLRDPSPKETCKVTGKGKKWTKTIMTRISAKVHLTSDPVVIGALQQLLSPALTADLLLGKGLVKIDDATNSKTKPKC